VVGVLAALVRRGSTGRGACVESSITAGTHGLTGLFHGMVAEGTWRLVRESNWLDGGAPWYRCYATADGQHVAVGAIERRFFESLLALCGLQPQIDVAQQHDRAEWPRIAGLLTEAFLQHTRDEWTRRAEGTDACVSPVLDFREAAAHPHNRANGWFDDETLGPRDVIRCTA
jgi:alpha-methylacyl-CoA racemase